MRPASYLSVAEEPSLRRRATGVGLTVLAHLLLLLLLLRLAPDQRRKLPGGGQMSVSLLPDAGDQPARVEVAVRAQRERAAQPPPPAPATPPPPPPLPSPNLSIIPLSREDMAASDIARLPSHASPNDTGAVATADAESADDTPFAPGSGPGGQRLYKVEWYRRPTHAEIAFYIKDPPVGSWAVIACKTADRFHVEDCEPLAESPVGSGYARAFAQAGWQLLLRPPHIGGRSLIGVWISIRLDFTETREN